MCQINMEWKKQSMEIMLNVDQTLTKSQGFGFKYLSSSLHRNVIIDK